jgi:hypothetical protein
VKELTNSGLRTVDYASGWSNRVPVAVRRAIVTGFNQVVAKINEDNAEKLETDMFEVSWHSGHRPSHWWGGRWYTKAQLVSVCGLGEPDGLCGCNCYHSYSPVVPGASVPTYTKEQLEKMEAQEQVKKAYGNKEYTKYEALQMQRKLETKMRTQRQEIKLLQEGGADENEIISAKVRYNGTSSEYVRFSEAMDLPQQRERVNVDGLQNIGNVKHYLKNALGTPIIEVKKTTVTGQPNSITQRTNKKGGVDRNYYGNDGIQKKQISNNDHGHKKESEFGNHGEHAHDYFIDENGGIRHGEPRELNDMERKENADIL